jgi:hypothetical protein
MVDGTMKIHPELKRAAREFARYCGEPWPISDYLLPRFVCEMIRWAKDFKSKGYSSQAAENLLKAARRKR